MENHDHVMITARRDKLSLNHGNIHHGKITGKSRRNHGKSSWSRHGHDVKFGGKSRSRSRHDVKFMLEEKPCIWLSGLSGVHMA